MSSVKFLLLTMTAFQHVQSTEIVNKKMSFIGSYDAAHHLCETEWGKFLLDSIVHTIDFHGGSTVLFCTEIGLRPLTSRSYVYMYGSKILAYGRNTKTKCGVFSFKVEVGSPDYSGAVTVSLIISEDKKASDVICIIKPFEICAREKETITRHCGVLRCIKPDSSIEDTEGCHVIEMCPEPAHYVTDGWIYWREICKCSHDGKLHCAMDE